MDSDFDVSEEEGGEAGEEEEAEPAPRRKRAWVKPFKVGTSDVVWED